MKNLYTLDTYAIIGHPAKHSKSPFIHAEFAKQTGQQIQYLIFEVPVEKFKETVLEFKVQGGKGLNITLPFKQMAWELVDQCSERAAAAKALSHLVIREDGTLYGDNTDGVGLVRDITQNKRCAIKDKKILIIGAGGAVRGALIPLCAEKPQEIFIANRTVSKAEALAKEFAQYGMIKAGGYEDLKNQKFDIIINATSASLKAELPPLPASLIKPEIFCYEMAYSTKPTIFMEWATKLGAKNVFDGVGMLVEHNAEVFLLWRGVRPDTKPVIEMLHN